MAFITQPTDTPECFGAHMGIWAAYAPWVQETLWALQRGYWAPAEPQAWWSAQADEVTQLFTAAAGDSSPILYGRTEQGVALVRVSGALTKGISKFGGASTILTRRAIRMATTDTEVKSLLLVVDSPGGQIPGVEEVVDEIWRARATKPVAAYVEDLAASGAYWIASAAQRLTGNAAGLSGNIGAFTVLVDQSGLAEREGVRVYVVATGPFKGAGVPGTAITEAILSDTQRLVTQFGARFFAAVQRGRRLSDAKLATVTDGRIWIAEEAVGLGLLDKVETFDEALAAAGQLRGTRQRMAGAGQRLAALRATWEGLEHG